jgi:hypothetical protein
MWAGHKGPVGVAMNNACLPNAILCLVAFGRAGTFGGWQVGVYVTLVACVCSIIQIVLVMRTGEGAPALDLGQ